MTSSPVRVAMYGATGETGGLIFDALNVSQAPTFVSGLVVSMVP